MSTAGFLTADEEATASVESLVLSHAPLVMKMARAFSRYGADVEDLIQEGNIGLTIAAGKFDPSRGNRFSTYAHWWVRQMMREAVISTTNTVRPSSAAKARARYFKERPHSYVSMSKPVPGLEDATLGDTMEFDGPGPDQIAEEAIDGARLKARLTMALRKLGEREQDIMTRRYLLEPPQTLEEVSQVHGVSRQRIQQIEIASLAKLKKLMGPP